MIARRSVLLLPMFAAACATETVVRSYPLPSYGYLTPIRLNVASIEVNDRSPPVAPDSIEALSPLRPADALKQMAADRISAAGSAGRAVFVIDQASLRRVGGGIEGMMAVHLDVYAGAGPDRAGFAEARVARRRTSSDTGEDVRGVLYDFVVKMMDDMNVEFEYQVKRSLHDWLQITAGVAPPPPPVQTQDLSAPGTLPPTPATPVLQPPLSQSPLSQSPLSQSPGPIAPRP